jgi:hypothetical protein
MMLAYNARPGTKDIDAIFRPRDEIVPIIEEVANEMNLDSNWLNDDVKVWVAENEQGALIEFREIAELSHGLSVKRPSAKYLLAMPDAYHSPVKRVIMTTLSSCSDTPRRTPYAL